MLEILALWTLANRIGKMVELKGYKSGWFKILTVALWFGGEITGAIVGAMAAGANESAQCLVYMFALMGAATGAGMAYLIAKLTKPQLIRELSRQTVGVQSSTTKGWLVIKQPSGTDWTYPLDSKVLTYIGRGEGNQVNLLYDSVAENRHAVIYKENNGFYVNNLSQKGTRVNGTYIAKQMLTDGSTLQVGNTVFMFRETR